MKEKKPNIFQRLFGKKKETKESANEYVNIENGVNETPVIPKKKELDFPSVSGSLDPVDETPRATVTPITQPIAFGDEPVINTSNNNNEELDFPNGTEQTFTENKGQEAINPSKPLDEESVVRPLPTNPPLDFPNSSNTTFNGNNQSYNNNPPIYGDEDPSKKL